MFIFMRELLRPVFILLILLLCGCAVTPFEPPRAEHSYGYFDDGSLAGRYAPIIAPQQPEWEYNLIGRAAARYGESGEEQIYIDTRQPVFYFQEQAFVTVRGNRYRNLIYRFHFPAVPRYHLTAGDNGGLFVIITLDERQQPVLITTVHSCGCYLAFIPTSYLDRAAYPDGWDAGSQVVYGEVLPGRLDYPPQFDATLRPRIMLRSGTHRVMNVDLVTAANYPPGWKVDLLPMSALDHLPLGAGETSFFYPSGSLKGYVKGAFKPWELLLMSWWSFDLHVGRDKRLGDPGETEVVFYTSLKPWARDESNMWFFADFLDYWGWRL